MTNLDAAGVKAVPSENLVTLAHVMYGLHAFSAVTGVITAAFIVTAFLTGWPSIIAVIINYVKRGEVAGTYLESHFRWQLRTFWYALLWLAIGSLLIVTIVGALIGVPLLVGVGLWVLYRIVRGWLDLASGKPLPS